MDRTQIATPLSPARTEPAQGTLDERITLAEQRLVAREQALRHGAQALVRRAQSATEPRRMVRPAVFALGVLALVWGAARLMRRRSVGETLHATATAASATAPAVSSASRFGEVPWMRAAVLLWPLLPAAWRGRMGADTASTLVAVGLPLAGLLFSKRARGPLQSQPSD